MIEQAKDHPNISTFKEALLNSLKKATENNQAIFVAYLNEHKESARVGSLYRELLASDQVQNAPKGL